MGATANFERVAPFSVPGLHGSLGDDTVSK